jgi:hypothetical protein
MVLSTSLVFTEAYTVEHISYSAGKLCVDRSSHTLPSDPPTVSAVAHTQPLIDPLTVMLYPSYVSTGAHTQSSSSSILMFRRVAETTLRDLRTVRQAGESLAQPTHKHRSSV